MAEQAIDALVLAQPETITYATGAFPGVASFWRRAGAAFVVVPRGGPLAAIVGDLQADAFRTQSGIADVRSHPIWVETGHYNGEVDVAEGLVASDVVLAKKIREVRPAQFDLLKSLAELCDMLSERGLLKARLGLELGFVAARDFPVFAEMLPDASFVDCTHLVERLRARKSPREIEILRTAAELADSGLQMLTHLIKPGMDAGRMTEIWREASLAEALRCGLPPPQSTWAYIAVGGDGFAPGGPAQPGDLIKIDVGCVINGYSSDGGRTAVLGKPSPAARKVYDALHRAFDAGLALLQPGVSLSSIHRAVSTTMWDAGFTTYGRGHFGHGVGASIWSEEWPFISQDATAIAEPGMVLAFEAPYYIEGLGGFIIEDQILITQTGIEVMAPSPRHLIEVGLR
jgi:Xaa-Pro dipeptidase